MTRAGTLHARASFLTVSTSVLAGDTIRLPASLDPWREAAAVLPLGSNEKLFPAGHGCRDRTHAPSVERPVQALPNHVFQPRARRIARAKRRWSSSDTDPTGVKTRDADLVDPTSAPHSSAKPSAVTSCIDGTMIVRLLAEAKNCAK